MTLPPPSSLGLVANASGTSDDEPTFTSEEEELEWMLDCIAIETRIRTALRMEPSLNSRPSGRESKSKLRGANSRTSGRESKSKTRGANSRTSVDESGTYPVPFLGEGFEDEESGVVEIGLSSWGRDGGGASSTDAETTRPWGRYLPPSSC
jgi:hypothetical protein